MSRTVSRWRLAAREVIARVQREHPEAAGADLRTLLKEAYPFGERKYTPYKLWLQEVAAVCGPGRPRKNEAEERGEPWWADEPLFKEPR